MTDTKFRATPSIDPEVIAPENIARISLRSTNLGKSIADPFYSPDGRWLYAASTVGIFAYDMISYEAVRLISPIPYGQLSPNGRIVVSSDGAHLYPLDKNPQTIDLELIPEFASQPKLSGLIFSSDHSILAQQYSSQTTQTAWTAVWRVADGKFIAQFEGLNATLSNDNRWIAVQRFVMDGMTNEKAEHVFLYDIQTADPLGEWPGTLRALLSDNSLVIESNGYVRIYDPVAYKVKYFFRGDRSAISPDEQLIALYPGNNCINIYRIADKTLLHTLTLKFTGWFEDAEFQFNADGSTLAAIVASGACCGGSWQELTLWNVAKGELVKDFYVALPYDFSPDGQSVTVGRQVFRASDGSLIADLPPAFIGNVANLAFTPDGRQLMAASRGYRDYDNAYLYEVTGEPIWFPQAADLETYLPRILAASPDPINHAYDVYSPDGKYYAHYREGAVSLIAQSGGEQPLKISGGDAVRVAFSPDSRLLAVGLADGHVAIWDLRSRKNIFRIAPDPRQDSWDYTLAVGGLAFSPDGKLLAIGSKEGTLRIFGINN